MSCWCVSHTSSVSVSASQITLSCSILLLACVPSMTCSLAQLLLFKNPLWMIIAEQNNKIIRNQFANTGCISAVSPNEQTKLHMNMVIQSYMQVGTCRAVRLVRHAQSKYVCDCLRIFRRSFVFGERILKDQRCETPSCSTLLRTSRVHPRVEIGSKDSNGLLPHRRLEDIPSAPAMSHHQHQPVRYHQQRLFLGDFTKPYGSRRHCFYSLKGMNWVQLAATPGKRRYHTMN